MYCKLVNHSVDIVKLYIFNPENDLALADGTGAYSAPPAAMRIANDLSTLPLWYGGTDGNVYLPTPWHREYHDTLAKLFPLASPYTKERLDNVTAVSPWGWSMQLHRRLKHLGLDISSMPTEDEINVIRSLSNRKSSIKILSGFKMRGVDTPENPLYFTNPDDVASYVNTHERCVIKAPWSGSGKGIMWGKGKVERPLEQFYKGIIKRQGGVVCENFLDAVIEFAMEFHYESGNISFAGYSLFTTSNAAYSGNIIATDSDIENFLTSYISKVSLLSVKETLSVILKELLAGSNYRGYLGVDMMIYNDKGNIRLNPCMELNLRMNMGMVSRLFYDSYVLPGKVGRYNVSFYKNKGEALAVHEKMKQEHLLRLCDGRIESGYLSLAPVTSETSYIAYVIIEEEKSVSALYLFK